MSFNILISSSLINLSINFDLKSLFFVIESPLIITGNQHKDNRGIITFVNPFLMDNIKRFYVIEPANTDVVRAWQGHKKEEKWFHVLSGSFLIILVKIDNWEIPSNDLSFQKIVLTHREPQVLHIPSGYANGFVALEKNAKLLVFSNATLEESINDDYRFDAQKWFDWTNKAS